MHALMTHGRTLLGIGLWVLLATSCAESAVIGVEPEGNAGSGGKGGGLGFQCAAGEIVCQGDVAATCTNDGSSAGEVDCKAAGKTCAPGYGCVTCVPYQAAGCTGDVGKMCNADGSGFVEFQCDPLQGMACGASGCTGACSPSALGPSYIGCDYYPTVTWNGVLAEWFDFAVAVANASSQAANVIVTRQDQEIAKVTLAPKSLEIVPLPWVADLKGEESGSGVLVSLPKASVLSKGGAYRLRSDQPVTVYQFNALQYQNVSAPVQPTCPDTTVCCPDANNVGGCFSYSNDASLLLPKTALTADYVVGGYRTATKLLVAMYEFAAITATEDGTEISLRSTSHTQGGGGVPKLSPGQSTTFTLDKGDVFQLLSNGTSLSGATIWSPNGKSFQVISGMPAAAIPDGMSAVDHIEEVALPAEALGRDYLVSAPTTPLGKRIHTVRIQPSRDPVKLSFDPPSVHAPVTVQAYEALELGSITEDFRVWGDGPFIVSQFMHGAGLGPQQEGAAGAGDPSQGLAVPTQQFRSQYTFLAPNDYDQNYVNVIAPTEANVRLDGVPIAESEFSPVGASGLKVARHALDRQQFHVAEGQKPFGIIVYGYGQYTSYMYPGGLDVKRFSPPPVK